MLQNLFSAIYGYYNNNTSLPAYIPELYFARAPDGLTGVYAVYSVAAARHEYDMTSRLEDVLLQFWIYIPDDSAAAGGAAAIFFADLWCYWFDDAAIELSSGTIVRMDRESYNIQPDPDGGWAVVIDYRIIAEHLEV